MPYDEANDRRGWFKVVKLPDIDPDAFEIFREACSFRPFKLTDKIIPPLVYLCKVYFVGHMAIFFIRPADPTVNDSCFFCALSCSICARTRNFQPGVLQWPSLSKGSLLGCGCLTTPLSVNACPLGSN